MKSRSPEKTYAQRKLEKLRRVDHHLSIALAELNKIAGGSYIGALRDLRDLVRLKLMLDRTQKRVAAGLKREERGEPV